jgi:hypothetical protein
MITFSHFNEFEINNSPLHYQMDYQERLQSAITRYLDWMDINAKGHRFWERWHHWRHGTSGRKRVLDLQMALRNSNNSFFAVVVMTGKTIGESGNTNHSFKRYLFEAMANLKVVNANPPVSDGDFFQAYNHTVSEEFNIKSTQHPHKFSYLGLIEGTRVCCKNLESNVDYEDQASYSP